MSTARRVAESITSSFTDSESDSTVFRVRFRVRFLSGGPRGAELGFSRKGKQKHTPPGVDSIHNWPDGGGADRTRATVYGVFLPV